MLLRQRIVTSGITTVAAATVAVALWLKPWTPRTEVTFNEEPIVQQTPAKGRAVDVVFALDTTYSMDSLLDGAKKTIWSIANQVKDIDPDADLRIGLVAYRDLGDAYVTKDLALTDDLDSVFAELSSYKADGGRDIPEDVDAALYDAVHKMKWRSNAKKIVFLVGDAPPATRGDVPAFSTTAGEAATAHIVINTIRCGWDGDTERAWKQIAMIADGEFSTIQQGGGVQEIATPYDSKLAELAAEVDATTVFYGDQNARTAWEGKMAIAAAAPAAAKADRGAYIAKGQGGAAKPTEDVVGGIATGALGFDTLEADKLPAELRTKTKAELEAELAARAKKREAARKEMTEVTRARDEYIKANAKDADGFDVVVKKTLDAQLK
jgi:hypothetical protein